VKPNRRKSPGPDGKIPRYRLTTHQRNTGAALSRPESGFDLTKETELVVLVPADAGVPKAKRADKTK
jgi:hypothetical protein